MDTLILRCPSVTYAQLGQRALEAEQIPSRLARNGFHGCTYGLEINVADREKALRILKEKGIIFSL